MTYEELTARLGRLQPRPERDYAVLVPVVEEKGEPELLFEVRAATLQVQPGEVCFPGGKVEPGEDPARAALRETAEELGLTAPLVELGPALRPVWHQAGFCTHPFLGRLGPGWRERLRLNQAEVGEIFTVPLGFFRKHPPKRYTCTLTTEAPADFPHAQLGFPQGYPWRQGRLMVPVWMWGDRPIWGLTGRMVLSLVDAL